MLTTVISGRVFDFSHVVGRNAAAGNGFAIPSALALAADGIAYVVSRGNENNFGSRVSKLFIGDPGEEQVLAEFCHYGTEPGQSQWPNSVALDRQGNVYVSDDWLNCIAIFDADGTFISQWGTSGSGKGALNGPAGLAFDQDDNLFALRCRVGVPRGTTPGNLTPPGVLPLMHRGPFMLRTGRTAGCKSSTKTATLKASLDSPATVPRILTTHQTLP
jgi:hypothetical protein